MINNQSSKNNSLENNSQGWSRRTFLKSSGWLLALFIPFNFLKSKKENLHKSDRVIVSRNGFSHSLLKDHEEFVMKIAEQYKGQGLSINRLVKLGNEGLIEAANHRYNTQGFTFKSYAVWWVRRSILQGLAKNNRTIRTSLGMFSRDELNRNLKYILPHSLN